jgi:acyl-CoA reductase-like NAD-dependent aldehyde dehydrogenase
MLLRHYADVIVDAEDEEIRPSMLGHTIVRREPVGVVGAITPWNHPQAHTWSSIPKWTRSRSPGRRRRAG